MSMRSLDIAATGMKAQEAQLDQIANDMANMNTAGYKRDRTEFQDLMYQTIKEPGGDGAQDRSPVGIQVGSGVKVAAQYSVHEPGPIQMTANNLDLAINGDGFFEVQHPSGQTFFTKAGAFKTSPQGQLLTSSGFPMVPNISIPPNSTGIKISPQGVVTATTPQGTESTVGQVQLASFINPSGLKKVGGNMFGLTTASGQAVRGNPGDGVLGYLQQGAIENSNVKPTESVMEMIKTQRTYETNAKIMNVADQMWSTTNNVGMK